MRGLVKHMKKSYERAFSSKLIDTSAEWDELEQLMKDAEMKIEIGHEEPQGEKVLVE